MVFWIVGGIIVVAIGVWLFLRTKEDKLIAEKDELEIKVLSERFAPNVTKGKQSGEKVLLRVRNKNINGYRVRTRNSYLYYDLDGNLIDDIMYSLFVVELLGNNVEFDVSGSGFDYSDGDSLTPLEVPLTPVVEVPVNVAPEPYTPRYSSYDDLGNPNESITANESEPSYDVGGFDFDSGD